MKVLITGGAGLVGSECCRLFAQKGYQVTSVDNYLRGKLFGHEGNTQSTIEQLLHDVSGITHFDMDIRNTEKIRPLVEDADVIIHTAAQPSHPKSIEIPLEDFSINAYGTLNFLELVRCHKPDAIFIYCSTNKVYGDQPNNFPIVEKETRYDFRDIDGIDESCPIDQCMHTPFGVSKAVADLYVQEYGRLYGLKTGVFRMGCITGSASKAVEMHNWEPYFVKKNLLGEVLHIYGYKGKQVRDVIHAKDLAQLFFRFVESPRPGEVYNVGGGRKNSISLLEAFDLIENITGKPMYYDFQSAREGDHIVYVSDLSKVKQHFDWDICIGLKEIFTEIYQSIIREL